MFNKLSRYRKLDDEVISDHQGRAVASKALRRLPSTPGDFKHSLEDVDRLDHLAYKYYRQPRKWWRICDANPEFLSPRSVLGKEPLLVKRFPLPNSALPAWAPLLAALNRLVGVEEVRIEEHREIVRNTEMVSGTPTQVDREQVRARYVVVRYNSANLSAENLASVMAGQGFNPGAAVSIERVGKDLIIPADTVA